MKPLLTLRFAGTFLVLLTLLSGCRSDEQVPNELQSGLPVAYSDSVAFRIYSLLQDSVRTDNLPVALVGVYQDPAMGTLAAQMFTQFQLGGSSVNFGDPATLTIDSVQLWLYAAGVYGSKRFVPTFHVYELTEDLNVNQRYYTNETKTYATDDLTGSGFAAVWPADEAFARIRIPLDPTLGQRLLTAPAESLANSAAFQAFFRGLAITTDAPASASETGGVYSIDVLNNATGLTLYYSRQVDTGVAKFQYTFPIGALSAGFFNVRVSNTEGKAVASLLNATAPDPNAEYLFLQAGTSIALRVELDNPQQLAPIAIQQAYLRLFPAPEYNLPDSGILRNAVISGYAVDPLTQSRMITARIADAAQPGPATSVRLSISSFSTNQAVVSNYFQQLVMGSYSNATFEIVPVGLEQTIARTVYCGPGHPDPNLRPRIELFYTPLPD